MGMDTELLIKIKKEIKDQQTEINGHLKSINEGITSLAIVGLILGVIACYGVYLLWRMVFYAGL